MKGRATIASGHNGSPRPPLVNDLHGRIPGRPQLQGQCVPGRGIMDVNAGVRAPQDRAPTHGYAEAREAAMTAFARSWWRSE